MAFDPKRPGLATARFPVFDLVAPLVTKDTAIVQASKHSADPSGTASYRDQLRQRFILTGGSGMPDYELLELVLFRAIPHRDVKWLARRLLSTFGDLNRVISANPARLREIEDLGEAGICEFKIIEAVANSLAQAKVLKRDVIASWDALLSYCKTKMAHLEAEQLRVLYLDRKNVLIADEAQAKGTVNHVPIYPRNIMKRALELGASAVILVHNHPSGDPEPSSADIGMTHRVAEAANALDIDVHDHVIVGKGRYFSFKSSGLL